jgi:hypothetical protein
MNKSPAPKILASLVLLGLLCLAGSAGANPYGYNYYRTITVDHTQVGTVNNTDQTSFPVVISGTYGYLATGANGGQIQQTTTLNGQTVPVDLIFTSDAAGTTLLNWEVASYTSSSGQIEVWVQIPTLSHTADTVIYMWYNNANIAAAYLGNATGAWDSNYQGVWHLANGSTLSAADSTANANTGTISGATATTGEIDGGASFNGSTAYITFGNPASLQITGNITTEAWINMTAWPSQGHGYGLLGMGFNANTEGTGWMLMASTDNSYNNLFQWYTSPGSYVTYGTTWQPSSPSAYTGSWHHLVGVFNGSAWILYVDGAQQTASSTTQAPTSMSNQPVAAAAESYQPGSGFTSPFYGQLDELRVSNSARSADWIVTEYNNQSSPSTFTTIGSQVPAVKHARGFAG